MLTPPAPQMLKYANPFRVAACNAMHPSSLSAAAAASRYCFLQGFSGESLLDH